MTDTMLWPYFYSKDGVTYKLDLNTHRGLWEILEKDTGKHVSFGPSPVIALLQAKLSVRDGVNPQPPTGGNDEEA